MLTKDFELSFDFQKLDNFDIVVQIENEVGVLEYVNEAFCKFHGVTKEDAVGRSCFDFIIPEDRKVCNVEKVVSVRDPYFRVEGRSKNRDGKILWLQYVGKAFFDKNGDRIGFQEIAVDITEWKEKIEQSAKYIAEINKWTDFSASKLHEQKKDPQINTQSGNFPAMYTFDDILTQNPKMKGLKIYAESVARGNVSILLEGESGTGKELFAQAIHNASNRSNGPFVAINCGVIPAELIGSELFGYVDGAFTGASKGGKPGKFEMASGGTLFLDEMGDMPLAQQVALLRVLETKTVTRIGGDREIPIDVRIICATNHDLRKEVAEGRFRMDLYYRLNVINLKIPPLRERKEDIFLIIGLFIKRHGKDKFNPKLVFTDEQLIALYEYDWPGNIRELQNVVERLIYVPDDTKSEMFESLFSDFGSPILDLPKQAPKENVPVGEEADILKRMMEEYEGNVSLVSRKLGISRTTLYKKLKQYGLR